MTRVSEEGVQPPPFTLGTFRVDRDQFPGFVKQGRVYRLTDVLPTINTTVALFADWDANLDALEQATSDTTLLASIPSFAITDIVVEPPVQPIGPIIAAGANYREHILEMSVAHRLGRTDATAQELWDDAAIETDERQRTGDPYIWTGLPSAVSGAFDDIQLPDFGTDIDWELELGVVIGKRTHRVTVDEAMDSVAGYTIVNDISARSLIARPDMAMIGTDWFRAKNQPTFFPTGPYLVPSRFIPDPTALRIQLHLNGQLMQDAQTDDLLFDIPSLIAYASSIAVLQPGDLLITGSPSGNGSHWKRFLKEGDVVEGSITGLGAQRSLVRGPSGSLPPWQKSRR